MISAGSTELTPGSRALYSEAVNGRLYRGRLGFSATGRKDKSSAVMQR
jgi:hypothetical protein